jgi:hypothetical protein
MASYLLAILKSPQPQVSASFYPALLWLDGGSGFLVPSILLRNECVTQCILCGTAGVCELGLCACHTCCGLLEYNIHNLRNNDGGRVSGVSGAALAQAERRGGSGLAGPRQVAWDTCT